ncbi:porin family protein [Xanthovirga aplysinae]|uniref:porin family protein n=1 Tax=Xanthovirga aplysinae TaxID=2529853 RepID=UPI0012BD617A|nr:porin family protein [Xanthovirga aplysinae]MTI31235.1 PorT family protein [Xanthovirga aplysinae]
MKKLLTLFLAIALGFTFANAQDINFGPRVGFNYAGYISEGDGSARPSLQFGAFLEAKLGLFSIQPEALISMQGVNSNLGAGAEALGLRDTDFTDKITYLNVPVMVKLNLPLGLNIQAGPQFGYVLSAKRDFEDDNLALPEVLGGLPIEDGDINNLKELDFTLNVGAGFEIGKFDIAARYNFGLTDLRKDKNYEPSSPEAFTDTFRNISGGDIKTQNLYLSVGYKIF